MNLQYLLPWSPLPQCKTVAHIRYACKVIRQFLLGTTISLNQYFLYTVKPVLRDHCDERPPVLKDHQFWAQSLTFQCKLTCHQRPPVLRDHIFMADGVVCPDRFHCMQIINVTIYPTHVSLSCADIPTLLLSKEDCEENENVLVYFFFLYLKSGNRRASCYRNHIFQA